MMPRDILQGIPFSKTVSAKEPIMMGSWSVPAKNSPFHELAMLEKSVATFRSKIRVFSFSETLT